MSGSVSATVSGFSELSPSSLAQNDRKGVRRRSGIRPGRAGFHLYRHSLIGPNFFFIRIVKKNNIIFFSRELVYKFIKLVI